MSRSVVGIAFVLAGAAACIGVGCSSGPAGPAPDSTGSTPDPDRALAADLHVELGCYSPNDTCPAT
jgi:hypothetical protein